MYIREEENSSSELLYTLSLLRAAAAGEEVEEVTEGVDVLPWR